MLANLVFKKALNMLDMLQLLLNICRIFIVWVMKPGVLWLQLIYMSDNANYWHLLIM
jgi:hypothetical protein